jgi:hypothetical protein
MSSHTAERQHAYAAAALRAPQRQGRWWPARNKDTVTKRPQTGQRPGTGVAPQTRRLSNYSSSGPAKQHFT